MLTQVKESIFGNLTGSHRNGIDGLIPVDQSGVLRPVGIVAWLYDWGAFFCSSLFCHNHRELCKIARATIKNKLIVFLE